MSALILGLLMFLGMHSVRIFAEGWRTQVIDTKGPGAWKGLYTVVSLVGFGLIVWGYGQARLAPLVLWGSPTWTRHLASLLVLVALVLLAAAYVPRNGIKAKLHHPMVLGVKSWALAHVLVNGNLAHLVLFGAFLAWAVVNFIAARRRDRAAGTQYPAGTVSGTVVAVLVGLIAWAAFAFKLHGLLIGIRPFG